MTRNLIFLIFVLLTGTSVAYSQTTATSPSPAPTVRRPALDQFGLSSGPFANTAPTASTPTTLPKKSVKTVAYVDQSTFDIVSQIIDKSAFLETELLRVLSTTIDLSPGSKFNKYFEHQTDGLMHVSSAQRTGSFGGQGIKSEELGGLLQQNEQTIREIHTILHTGAAEYGSYSKELNEISEKYGVALLKAVPSASLLNKPALLKTMMARINQNYAGVKEQMRVK